jgi:hypothetical protein
MISGGSGGEMGQLLAESAKAMGITVGGNQVYGQQTTMQQARQQIPYKPLDYEDYYLSQKIRKKVHTVHNTVVNWEKLIYSNIDSKMRFDFKGELTRARQQLEAAIEEIKVLEEKHLLQDV